MRVVSEVGNSFAYDDAHAAVKILEMSDKEKQV